jgi:NAD(P)-dependent dehydrogenase (short-subunit alcohol dehydrogenase family)
MIQEQQRPIGSGFGRTSTAAEVVAGIDLSGKVAVVTGGYSGIGVETTRALAGAGATVVVPVRDRAKASETLSNVSGDIRIESLDLADLSSVRALAARILDQHEAVHILINNAGVMACPETRVGPGAAWEAQFAINYLGHFVLTNSLLPALERARGARVICLSSSTHHISPIRWDDVHFTNAPYEKWTAYGQSKTANSLFAVGLDRRHRASGIRAFAVDSGGVKTPLQRHLPVAEMAALGWVDENGKPNPAAASMFKSVEAGAATSVWCATSPQLSFGGVYCEDCDVASVATEDSPPFTLVLPWAIDTDAADRLWDLALRMLDGSQPLR